MVEGYYWMREPQSSWEIVEVVKHYDSLVIWEISGTHCSSKEYYLNKGAEFIGPIPTPN